MAVKAIDKHGMPETFYRASRCCRLLGNPTAYLIIKVIGKTRITPTEISRKLNISLATVSRTLRHLRNLDLVRYEATAQHKIYWIKDEKVFNIMSDLEKFVENIRKKRL